MGANDDGADPEVRGQLGPVGQWVGGPAQDADEPATLDCGEGFEVDSVGGFAQRSGDAGGVCWLSMFRRRADHDGHRRDV